MTAQVGIASTGLYLPAGRLTSADVAEMTGIPQAAVEEKLGIRQKPRARPDEHVSFMAAEAARQALREGGVDPDEVDLVIWTGSEYKDYPVWSAGIRLQEDLGLRRAWAVDVAARCSTNIVGLKFARDLMIADDRLRTVLLAGGHRTADLVNYRNARSRFLFNLSDAGSAIVVRRDWPRHQVLETAVVTDGAFNEDVIIPAGGTRRPTSPETIAQGLHFFDVPDPEGMKQRLDRLSMANFVRVVRESVQRSGFRLQDIGYLALLHMKRSAHQAVLTELGLSPEQSIYLEDYGHVGAPDQVISLRLAEERGLLRDGMVVVLASAGIGYTWAATTVRWGVASGG